jgi:ABC-type iron transport system FetAB permease component
MNTWLECQEINLKIAFMPDLRALVRRCIVQLTILGFILVPIFTTPYWYVVVLYALLMGIVGAWEATSRPTHTYKVLYNHQSWRQRL